MYRNSIIYIVLVILILSLVIIPSKLFDNMIRNDIAELKEKIEIISEMCQNEKPVYEIEEKCTELLSYWEKHMRHWGFYINHTSIEKIDIGVCAFTEMARAYDITGVSIEKARLYKIFEITANQDSLTFVNIF